MFLDLSLLVQAYLVLGTGKSFIGTLIAKALHDLTSKTILVVCYTNHALDDILESLLDIGIPPEAMLRLGGKSTPKTEPLLPRNQARNAGGRSRDQWTIIDRHKQSVEVLHRGLVNAFNQYKSFKINLPDILDYLEFEQPHFYGAFKVPDPEDGMEMVGKRGQKISRDYLLFQWQNGRNAGIYDRDVRNSQSETTREIWDMKNDIRRQHFQQWVDALLQESIESLATAAKEYNECHEALMRAQSTSLSSLLSGKRIVGCTTTAAAKYDEIRTFNPGVLLVEEAGEILESHILTALGPETSQMILIGDHK